MTSWVQITLDTTPPRKEISPAPEAGVGLIYTPTIVFDEPVLDDVSIVFIDSSETVFSADEINVDGNTVSAQIDLGGASIGGAILKVGVTDEVLNTKTYEFPVQVISATTFLVEVPERSFVAEIPERSFVAEVPEKRPGY